MSAATEQTASLQLAGGTRVEIAGDPRDLSVFVPIRDSGGSWEPHVRRCFERVVRPDFVCLDIGANIGAHALSLAALAARVVAFEASPRNALLLRRNAASSGRQIEVVNQALWDAPGALQIASIDQLGGCSFISPDRDAAASETTLRSVVTGEEVRRIALDVHHDTVPATRLDDWVATAGLRRIDLIKLDVEGAETRVLAGAARTLSRFRPLLVTEYNPDTARQYFAQADDAYFRVLQTLFQEIAAIEPDGTLSEPLTAWEPLRRRLAEGRGWEDLLCRPAPRGGIGARLRTLLGGGRP